MSDLRGISEKCADALKMYEPLVVLDDVVVTVDKEKERLYIVSKEDGACKEFKLGDSGIEKKTDEEQLFVDSSNSIYRLFRTISMFSYKNNMCGYGDKLYIFSYKSFSNQVAQMFDIKTFEKKDMMGDTTSFGNMLFDLNEDPTQNTQIHDEAVEMRMKGYIREYMEKNDAPKELYKRLGL